MDNSAFVCDFKGMENKAQESVHQERQTSLSILGKRSTVSVVPSGHVSRSHYKQTKSISCGAFYGKFTQPVLAKNRFPPKLRFQNRV